MKHLLVCVLLFGVIGTAQTAKSIQSIFLALKDSKTPRKVLSDQLTDEMMALAKQDSSRPSRAAVERFSDDLITALMGKDITTVRASVLQRAVSDLLTGKGSTFEPATKLRTTLTSCGINEPTTQAIVGRFIDIGQEVRGPDDVGVQKPPPMK
jgi:hypothetical protein